MIELVPVAVAAGAGVLAGPMVSRYVEEGRLARSCTRRRTLVLTYDDGPGRELTPRVLDLLATHGARASFFALGRNADASPAVLDRVVREGHEVGCHTYSHLHAWKSMPWTAARDVSTGLTALAPWMRGPGPTLFRPPYGKLTPFTWATARSRGARMAWWTLDSGDTWDALPDPASIVAEVRRRQGGVVLMHDFDRHAARGDYVLALTEALLVAAEADGLRVAPFGDLEVPRREKTVARASLAP